jgi:Alginate export
MMMKTKPMLISNMTASKIYRTLLSSSVLVAMSSVSAISYADNSDISNLWNSGKFTLDTRLRLENVSLERPLPADTLRGANAWTLRIRPGFQTGAWNGLSAAVEAGVNVNLNDEFNSTRNGETKYATVVDPKNVDFTQLNIKYAFSPAFNMTVGRQLINLDNQRFVGAVGWRQNVQTFDAASFNLKPTKELGFYYAYIDRVNTIFGVEDTKPTANNAQRGYYDSNSHLVQFKYTPAPLLSAVAYAYLLDLDKYSVTPTAKPATNSNKTFGIRATGAYAPFRYALEYAKQSNYGPNPLTYSADYYLIEGTVAVPQLKALPDLDFTVGYEVLGNDSSVTSSLPGSPTRFAFQTPLATKHLFNGFADLFLATPAYGLVDTYIGTSFKIPTTIGKNKVKVAAAYHWYSSEEGSSKYGQELNLILSSPIALPKSVPGALSVLTKYARYSATDNAATDAFPIVTNGGNRDNDKFWLQLDYKY